MSLPAGLYPMDEVFPYAPTDLLFPKYIVPDTLRNTEAEELAARIISFSQGVGQWVGVSAQLIIDQLASDAAAIQKSRDAKEAKIRAYDEAVRAYRRTLIVSLGIAYFFTKKPVWEEFGEPTPSIFTVLTWMPGAVGRAVYEHEQNDWSRKELVGEDLVYFPTPKLISAVQRFRISGKVS